MENHRSTRKVAHAAVPMAVAVMAKHLLRPLAILAGDRDDNYSDSKRLRYKEKYEMLFRFCFLNFFFFFLFFFSGICKKLAILIQS